MAQHEVILIEDVQGLGEQGNLVKVTDGYARNFLLPKKLAVKVSAGNLRQLEKKQADYEAHRMKLRAEAEALSTRIADIELKIPAKVGNENKIFGSVTSQNIHEALEGAGISIDRHQIVLEQPIKELGTYKIPIKLTSEIHPALTVSIVSE
ncbi:MAG: 50S ribosomal protein L9 [Verrucomicrobia bacterium]|nr:50S ribosomal protein L9 [Kiritimatiellia bacterium]MCB1102400.1 50S ribosomal protein L9 [Kiritimatiellia bacterium]MCP5488761.1 50S ribosomal protein L9 [Verrucomicrobiota bacterium]